MITSLLIVCVLLAGCDASNPQPSKSDPSNGPPTVYVVNFPLFDFAKRIGGEDVLVRFPVPADQDPAFWKPSESDIRAIQAADLVITNGAGYADWLRWVTLAESRVVDSTRTIRDQYVPVRDGIVHRHGPIGEHAHEGIATHTWLNPRHAIAQAAAIQAALGKLVPNKATEFERRFFTLKRELQQLDERLAEINQAHDGGTMLASHPVYDYLADRCDWDLRSVHWEPHQVPSESEWDKLNTLVQEHKPRWMLWEQTPHEQTASRLQAMGITVVVFDPCGNADHSASYVKLMLSNLERLGRMN
ncbi:MAG: metal ABC transporter substrate-binding protein [Planctomycetota bacterium]|nr:metal ABC transporter substrate-binding protein [Planctomycetota bacterium]